MAVGHGQLGGRSNLRTFRELVSLSAWLRNSFIEIDSLLLADGAWVASGPTYTISPAISFEDIALDVTGVRTLDEVLTRTGTDADCVATAGTYSFSPGGGLLRIHLTAATDPNTISVRITVTFGFCTGGMVDEDMVQPGLGSLELLTDPDVEDWASSTNLTSYTEDLAGAGWVVNQDTSIVWHGGSSAKLSATGAAAGSAAIRQTPNVFIGGIIYRACGYYMTPDWAPASQHVYVRYGTTVSLGSDGRTAQATLTDGSYELDPTLGEWKFFVYDFMAHESAARLAFRLVNGSAVASEVHFDKLSLRQVHTWRYYKPLVAEGGVPEVQMGAADVYPGSEELGTGQVQMNNGIGDVLERMFSPPFFYISADVRVLHGGCFPGGQEILYNDMEPGHSGVIAGPEPIEVTDEAATIQVSGPHEILSLTLPTRAYNETDQPDGESRDRGRPRALVLGVLQHARPSRIDLDGTTGYGVYELSDTTDWADGIGGAGAAAGGTVRAYPDEESADKMDQAKFVDLIDGKDYSQDLVAGTMEILVDVGVREVNRENNKIDFDVGGAALVATIPDDWYTLGYGGPTGADRRGLLDQVADTMSAASGVTIEATYSETTHLVTITRASKGTLNILWNSGVNAATSLGPTLGFDGGADDTGSVTYTADSVLFEDPDSTHIIRADIAGFADDAGGTYTGVGGDTIQKGPDILRFIFLEILGLPTSRIDLASFVAARSSFPAPLGAYLGGLASITGGGGFDMTVQDVVDRLENGAAADGSFLDISPDGTGTFFYTPRPAVAPATAPHLKDRDFLAWRGFYVGDDVAATTRVNYGQNPSTGVVKGSELTAGNAILLYGRPQTKTFDTFLTVKADADTCCAGLQVLTQAAIRHFEFTEPGHLLGSKVGDLILLTRERALQGVGESGGLDADTFRIMALTKNFDSGVCTATVHTNLAP